MLSKSRWNKKGIVEGWKESFLPLIKSHVIYWPASRTSGARAYTWRWWAAPGWWRRVSLRPAIRFRSDVLPAWIVCSLGAHPHDDDGGFLLLLYAGHTTLSSSRSDNRVRSCRPAPRAAVPIQFWRPGSPIISAETVVVMTSWIQQTRTRKMNSFYTNSNSAWLVVGWTPCHTLRVFWPLSIWHDKWMWQTDLMGLEIAREAFVGILSVRWHPHSRGRRLSVPLGKR